MHGAKWTFETQRPELDLDRLVRQRIGRLAQAERGSGIRVVLGIAVERRDGMTDDALRAHAAIEEAIDRGWTLRWLSGSAELQRGALGELSDLLGGVRPVLAAARRSGLVPELRRRWGWWLLAALLVVLGGVAATLLSSIADRPGTGVAAAIGLLVAALAAGLVAKQMSPEINPLFGPRAIARLEQALAREPLESDVERQFRLLLLDRLAGEQRGRAVVVDDLGLLRPRTRRLIKDHLELSRRSAREEMWVLFERGLRPGRARRRVARSPSAPNLSELVPRDCDVWLCRQQPLSSVEKRQLLHRIDGRAIDRADQRLRYRAIGDVLGHMRDEQETIESLSEQLQGVEPAVVQAFALLALEATAPAPAWLAPEEVSFVLRSRSPHNGPLQRLLRNWFPVDRRQVGTIQQSLSLAIEELDPLFEERPGSVGERKAQVATLYADALASGYSALQQAHGLPSIDHAHAFWALYWHRVLTVSGGWSALVAERLSAHICALREPASLAARHDAETARALCEAAIDAAQAAIALCVRGIADDPASERHEDRADDRGHGVLEQAHMLLAGRRSSADRRLLRRLLDVAWMAYMLTGEPALIERISLISQECEMGQPAGDELIEMYLQTLPCPPGTALPPLVERESGQSAAVADCARARAAWLAMLVEPLTRQDESRWLAERAAQTPAALQRVAERAVGRLARPGGLAETLDYVTIAIVASGLELVAQRGGPIDQRLIALIAAAAESASARSTQRTAPGAPASFVLDAALRHCQAAAQRDASQLEQLHVMWHNLQMHELADLAALQRNVLRPPQPGSDGAIVDHLVGLVGESDRPIDRVCSELLIGVDQMRSAPVIGGVTLVQAACAAMGADLGQVLVFELCKAIVLQNIEVDGEDNERVLMRALHNPPGLVGVLDVPDAEVAERLLPLLNCVHRADSEAGALLQQMARERRETIGDAWSADRVDQRIEYAEAQYNAALREPETLSRFLERWRARIWSPGLPPEIAKAHLRHIHRIQQANATDPTDLTVVYEIARDGAARFSESLLSSYRATAGYTYSFVLSRLWPKTGDPGIGMVEDATRLLHDATDVTNRGCVALAKILSDELSRRGECDSSAFSLAIEVQREGIAEIEHEVDPYFNFVVYSQLARHDEPNAAAHSTRAVHWRIEDERLAETDMFLRAADSRFFEVFWHHFTREQSLRCNLSREEVLAGCQAANGALPAPIVVDELGHPSHLSGTFLAIGHRLLHLHPGAEDRDGVRARLHRLAQEHVNDLYVLLIERAGVHADLRRIFEEQRKRFEEM